jgi:hypothetical protein
LFALPAVRYFDSTGFRCIALRWLLNRDLRALLTLAGQVLDTLVENFADSLEELDPRIRQVLANGGRNPEEMPESVDDLTARAWLIDDVFVRSLLFCL